MDFEGPTQHENRFRLASLEGRWVVVTFWASWCPACRQELPRVNSLVDRYADRPVEFVGVSLDGDAREMQAFLEANDIGWRQVFSPQTEQSGWLNPIAQYYRVQSVPLSFVVDGQGLIVASGLHAVADIEAALAEQLPHG
jgi:thiol-disulfide isomerase/thioredoxin